MCFTVNVNLIKEELENRYGATLIDPDKYRPSYYYHAFAFPDLPVLCSGDPGKLKMLKWGLIPSWTRSLDDAKEIRLKTLNARSESVNKKPSFSSSFRSKRCIVPVKGFYEWQHSGKEKIPWYIYRSDNEIMSLAGIYDEWEETNTGQVISTFSILTTDATDLMAEIHNSAKRMPLVLDKNLEQQWIDISTSEPELMKMLAPYPSEILKAHTIGPLINSRTAERNSPEVIAPYTWHKDNLLF